MERIVSKLDQRTKKWEFIYKEDWDNGAKYYVKEDTPYIICYGTDKKEMYMDSNKVLIRLKNHTLYSEYSKAKRSLKREVYLKPYQLTMTKKKRDKGSVIRYFAQSVIDNKKSIIEIKKQDFEKETNFYKKISLNWKLDGTEEQIKMINEEELNKAEKKLDGMLNHLSPLEFYEGEELTKHEKIQKKLSNLKY